MSKISFVVNGDDIEDGDHTEELSTDEECLQLELEPLENEIASDEEERTGENMISSED